MSVHVCTCTSTHLFVCVFPFILSSVLVSPQASVNDLLFSQRSTNWFPSSAANFQPGPDPHLDQLESICYCKYKFGNLWARQGRPLAKANAIFTSDPSLRQAFVSLGIQLPITAEFFIKFTWETPQVPTGQPPQEFMGWGILLKITREEMLTWFSLLGFKKAYKKQGEIYYYQLLSSSIRSVDLIDD